MRTSRTLAKQIVATYAETLFEAAQADDAVDAVGAEIDSVAATVRGHADLRDALRDDAVPAEVRGSIVREVFASAHPALIAMLGVLVERGDAELLASVAEDYAEVAEKRRDTVTAEVTTVFGLTDSLREAIRIKLSADFGKTVVIRETVDPAIIGGIVISAHGNRLDASIASQLEAARVTLSTAYTGGDA